MELIQYIRLFRRWLWLIVLLACIGAGIGFMSAYTRPDSYRARIIIAVGSYFQQPNPDSSDIRVGIDLTHTYAQLVRYYEVLSGVAQSLQLPFSPESLSGMIDTRIITSTSLLEIGVTYTDAALVAAIANELAFQLIQQGPSGLTPEQQQQIVLLDEQINSQRLELEDLRTLLEQLNTSISDETLNAETRQTLQQQRSTIINQINEANGNIAAFSSTKANLQQRTNSIEIVERARVPASALDRGLLTTVLLGAMLGAGLAFGAVLLLEYLNNTYRNADELAANLNTPVLGVITQFGNHRQPLPTRLLTNMPNLSHVSEEYRVLRTNLTSNFRDKQAFIITSASPKEGKSITASNLAVSMALSGLRVLLIDADLRRPTLHEIFNLDNQHGLTTLLMRKHALETGELVPAGIREVQLTEETWQMVVSKPNIPNLFIITSGALPSNPAELLGSTLMKRWNEQFCNYPLLDVIIYDTPPVLAVSDSAVLAASTQGSVIMVVKARETRRDVSQRARERFDSIDNPVVGLVLNHASLRDESYYGDSYSEYYNSYQKKPEV